jgi:zinc protease
MAASLAQGLSPVRVELANGGVILVQETVMTPAVTISASFRAGSMFDPVGLPGLAYLTGRAIDRGTERRSASMMADELDERGVSMRVSSNRQALTVSCTCLAEDFDDVLAIVADIVRNPAFPQSEIEKRRSEALTILRQNEDNPAARAVDAVLELLYGWHHPYGRPPKGTVIGVESVSRADMVAFHAARVRPAAMSLAIVGDVRPEHAVERATQAFDDWIAEPPAPATVPPPPPSQGRRTRVIAMPGKTQTDIVYGFTAIRRLDPRYYAYWMMNNVLG